MSSSSSAGSEGMPKWQVVAAAVGVGVAVVGTVGAVVYLCSRGGSKKEPKGTHQPANSVSSNETGSTTPNNETANKELVSGCVFGCVFGLKCSQLVALIKKGGV